MTEAVGLAIITGAGPVLAVLVSAFVSAWTARAAAKKVNEIHVIVNNQRSEMMKEIDDLKARLSDQLQKSGHQSDSASRP